ncbi:MAG: hypothetical protein AABY22_05795 [Nanoarchaeota archaeon]
MFESNTKFSNESLPAIAQPNVVDSALQLSPININDDYRKKWNIYGNDFSCLTKNGQLISDSLYRIGGFGANLEENYFMLLKHVEAFYSNDIMKMSKSKDARHLESRWCILDKNGIEKKVFDQFKTPYIKKGTCIYSIDSNYYNIETGDFYCNSSKCLESTEFIFLENSYDQDLSKRGVIKINKQNGTLERWS